MQALGLWWLPTADGAMVLRVLGDTPCPTLPAVIDGRPVTEIGPYCFAARQRPLPDGAMLWGTHSEHAIHGQFLEEAALPDSVHTLHSAAFYDCRRLRVLAVGPGLRALGSDLFTNCRALDRLVLHAALDADTGLKRILGAISADIGVDVMQNDRLAARLFYPEYWEVLDENAPAHLFDRGIEGEGYRYRQCFAGNRLDFAAYDATFPQATVGEAPAKLCRLALGRLLWPYALREDARALYAGYLCAQPQAALQWAVTGRDLPALQTLLTLGLPAAQAAALCRQTGWSEGAAAALGGPKKGKKSFTFE